MELTRRKFRAILLFPLAGLLIASNAGAQDNELDRALKQFSTGGTVSGYLQPIADCFGANMNSGWYQSASIPTMGIHVQLSIVGMVSMIGDGQKTFNEQLPPGYSATSFKAPTVFGPKEGAVYTDPNSGLTYGGSGGIFNTPIFPWGVPQLTIGSVYGTEATVRYIATPSIGNGDSQNGTSSSFPSASMFGLGVRHSISQYLPLVPVDLAAGFLYNSVRLGDIVSFKSFAIGAQVSKSYAILTLFGGLQWERSTLSLSYQPSLAGAWPVTVDMNGANSVRLTAGLNISLGLFKLFADANLGSVTTFSGGLGLGI